LQQEPSNQQDRSETDRINKEGQELGKKEEHGAYAAQLRATKRPV
jgi:hypothetical protein